MLPILHRNLTHALNGLSKLDRGPAPVRLRVRLWDGSLVEGTLLSASESHVSLVLPGARARLVRVDEIRSVYRARRRWLRWLAVVTGGIITATAGIAWMSEIPLLSSDVRAVAIFLLLGAALAMQIVTKTSLGAWLTAWEPLFETPDHQPDQTLG